jgi:GTP1/Obg family GTP-binding protein
MTAKPSAEENRRVLGQNQLATSIEYSEDRRTEKMQVSVKNLREKLESTPEIPEFHFPSWDLLYMRDIKKLEKWIADFTQTFEQFETGLQEALKKLQDSPTDSHAIAILKEVLGEQ